MEVIEFIEDLDHYDDDDEHIRRPRVLRDRTDYFEQYDEMDFFRRFRMNKNTALFVLDQIEHQLAYADYRNAAIAPINQLLIALRFYATGCHLTSVADYGGVSSSSSCRIVKKVSHALASLLQRFVKFPTTNEERNKVKHDSF
ncbi:unnamed protein product [Acanthoscelides obtectus]|uniref:Nuclease HARBI1 n=1 Tax=Acanthoscelides obtectus TaxID=200917 RepID=A0A9P0L561_ACAOB|nr:unnamed protein product [Acanthoscelides obtectus]CAK1671776.1 Putative nuclease HARBI1 [Acanthoscelides obtectus]